MNYGLLNQLETDIDYKDIEFEVRDKVLCN